MTVWVTGASGMLGRSIGRRLEAASVPWVGSDLDIDIADRAQVEGFVRARQPSLVINCAAYTAVDAAETDAATARRVNAEGTGLLAECCRDAGASFVHFSTDYVFDGRGPDPYGEDAPIAPGNVYGATKAEGEALVARAYAGLAPGAGSAPGATAHWWILRTSWLFGSGRSSFVDTMWSLMQSKDELRVVDDQIGRPTYVEDLANTALTIALFSSPVQRLPSGTFHFANRGATSWFGLASEIRATLETLRVPMSVKRILPVPSSEFPRPAVRPAFSVLSTERIEKEAKISPRDWQVALREYLQLRARLEARARNELPESEQR